ncbi:DsbA oxidoreductase [Sulfurifustis variabilis]|uniref:DsbA oxidoreductase n=1 Tax=Sulfurifustis variabilis TaxID=1675686 RepID=A0A1B4VCT3_9GAMM|nr:disulfide bond formation protein DsbA [Sulfurifustis variabilis]BAU49721.1 DsbA oxidoreductase [Sulfurifustis variabilis]
MAVGKPVTIEYFTDVLCVWAYAGQVRIDELKKEFGNEVDLVYRFLPLFAASEERIGRGWRDRGGYAGFGRHVQEIAGAWSHVTVHPRLWLDAVPASSTPAHLFLKAVQLLERRGEIPSEGGSEGAPRSRFPAAAWRMRQVFFEDARNVASREVLEEVARSLNLPSPSIQRLIEDGEAHAAFHLDIEAKERYQVPGSPTLVLNQGRQRLYGNVGYRIIEANVRELLRNPHYGEATWC